MHPVLPQRARGEVHLRAHFDALEVVPVALPIPLLPITQQLEPLNLLDGQLREIDEHLGLHGAERPRHFVYSAEGAEPDAVRGHQRAAGVEGDVRGAQDQRVVLEARIVLRALDHKHGGELRLLGLECEGAEAGLPRRAAGLQAAPRLEPLVILMDKRNERDRDVQQRSDDARDAVVFMFVLLRVHDLEAVEPLQPHALVIRQIRADVRLLDQAHELLQVKEQRLTLQAPTQVHVHGHGEELGAIAEEVQHLVEVLTVPVEEIGTVSARTARHQLQELRAAPDRAPARGEMSATDVECHRPTG
mmetsp:Transcript_99461/g.281705  ORF Transcript_99461/g.281705 Transcript_99461/m.281705 type:complete len:303 (+) Transcript_99461:1200-2108(+)